MTWSYSGNPASSELDEVRFLVGDTDTTDQLVQNEEISWALTEEANPRMAAARVALALALKFSRKADKQVGDLRIAYSSLYKHYLEVAEALKADAATVGVVPYAGGISISDKDTVENDTDRYRPSFRRGMHDNPSETPEESEDICDRS
jgi:hypothetical protein